MPRAPTSAAAAHSPKSGPQISHLKKKEKEKKRHKAKLFFIFNRPTIFLPEPGDEFLGRDDSDFLLLGGDAVEQVCQAGEEGLLPPRLHLR